MRLIHKLQALSEKIQDHLGLTDFQHLWLAFLNGAVFGYIAGAYL